MSLMRTLNEIELIEKGKLPRPEPWLEYLARRWRGTIIGRNIKHFVEEYKRGVKEYEKEHPKK